mmetsp:Transcript_4544/g.15130  ORF Transcript_4544/g.15130 Transcript_4544/m.15130 type:complete len:318 (-) Transcript_4544:1509-2462(-)
MGAPSPAVLRATQVSIAVVAEPTAPELTTIHKTHPSSLLQRRSKEPWHRKRRRQSSFGSEDMFTRHTTDRRRARYRDARAASPEAATEAEAKTSATLLGTWASTVGLLVPAVTLLLPPVGLLLPPSAAIFTAALAPPTTPRSESFAAVFSETALFPDSAYLRSIWDGPLAFSGFVVSLFLSSASFPETSSNAFFALLPTETTDALSSSSSAFLLRSRSSFPNEYETKVPSAATNAPVTEVTKPIRENVNFSNPEANAYGDDASAFAQERVFARRVDSSRCLRRSTSRCRNFSASAFFAATSSAFSSANCCSCSRSAR